MTNYNDFAIKRLERLLEKLPDKGQKGLFTFYKRVYRERQHLFTFLFIEDVPLDNNASGARHPQRKSETENIGTVQDRESGKNFAKIRSIIDTTIKNGMNILDALALIAKLQPQASDRLVTKF